MSESNAFHDQAISQGYVANGSQETSARAPITSPPVSPHRDERNATRYSTVEHRANKVLRSDKRTKNEHEYYDEDSRLSRVGVYVSATVLFIGIGLGAFLLGNISNPIFQSTPELASGQVDQTSRKRPEPSNLKEKATSIATPTVSESATESRKQLPLDPTQVSERVIAPSRPMSSDSAFAQFHQLDDAFTRFKVSMLDFRNAEHQRGKELDRNVALTRAISTGQLQLKTGNDPRVASTISLVYVPAGRFQMGQTDSQRSVSARESASAHFDFSVPAHNVSIQSGFFIGVYEVSQGQLSEFIMQLPTTVPNSASKATERNHPATNVDWLTAVKFCEWLSQVNDGILVRLPTETEFEYALRGNTYVQQFESIRERNMFFGWTLASRRGQPGSLVVWRCCSEFQRTRMDDRCMG